MQCYNCSRGTLHHKTKSQAYNFKGKTITLEQSALWCNSCDEGILNGEDIAKTEKPFEDFKMKVDLYFC